MMLVFMPRIFGPRQQPAPKGNQRDECLAILICIVSVLMFAGVIRWMEM